MRIAKETSVAGHAPTPQPHPLLAHALSSALNLPLGALRASMETLAQELGRTERVSTLPAVLAEVDRIGRSVRDLIDYTQPPEPLPLVCTLQEIAAAARNELPESERTRVSLACHDARSRILVDGPIVSRCLRRLLENAFEAGAPTVLVVSRRDGDGARFTVVDDASLDVDTDWALEPFHSTKSNHLGLGLHLVTRDLALLGGSLELTTSPQGTTCAEVRVPAAPAAAATPRALRESEEASA